MGSSLRLVAWIFQRTHTQFCSATWLCILAAWGVAVMICPQHALADSPRYRIIVIAPPDEAPTFEFFPAGYMGINNRGEVVSTVEDDEVRYSFVWLPAPSLTYNDGLGLSVGTHTLPDPGQFTSARKINVNGFVVGRSTTLEDATSAYLWNLTLELEECGSVIEVFDCDCGEHMHKEEATDINDADPPMATGMGWVVYEPFIQRAFRKEIGSPIEETEQLGPVLTGHFEGWGNAISDSGFVAGYTDSGAIEECDEEQDVFRCATWPGITTDADNLSTLGTSAAESFTIPTGVNNADPNMIVGWGQDPTDTLVPCRERALFWEGASANPIVLPFLVIDSVEVKEPMRAFAIADPFADDSIQVVGRAENSNAAVLWVRIDSTWEAIDLNTLSACNTDGVTWAILDHAFDINSCGWIAGTGILDDDSPRAFVLVPMDMCPGDLVSGSASYPDGVVNTSDMLYVINKWNTSDCVADITEDSTVSTPDLLAVINNWGPCVCFPSQMSSMSAPESNFSGLSQMLNAANLTENQWDDFLETMATGTESERENYLCWMQQYLSGCSECPSCPGSNPFQN